MPSTYIPYQLVHAHLPAPPSIPKAIPQLQVPTDRPFPETSEELDEPIHPDHAVSVVYDPTTGILARSIQNGYGLELRTLSFDIQKGHSHSSTGSEILRISFPDQLRPLVTDCIVTSTRDSRLYILLVTLVGVVYRLNFPLGTFKPGVGDRFVFTTKGNDQWCEEWLIPDDVIASCGGFGAWTVIDENALLLGGVDGGVLRVTRSSRSNGQWSATHHRATSRLRLPSLFSRTSDTVEMIISFASFHHESQLSVTYTVSRDYKLRTWNPATGACIRTTDVQISSPSSQDLVVHSAHSPPSQAIPAPSPELTLSLIRVIPHPSASSRYSHLVILFIPTPHSSTSAGTFAVYRASNTSHGASDLVFAGARAASAASAGSENRGFEVLEPIKQDGVDGGWQLAATWDRKGVLFCESVCMDDLFQFTTYVEPHGHPSLLLNWQSAAQDLEVERYDAAHFDNILNFETADPEDPHENSDIQDVFLGHLFDPGRFSQLTLSTALEEYIHTQLEQHHLVPEVSAAYSDLSDKFAAIVGCQIQMENSPQTGAPMQEAYRERLKLDWLGVWARVKDLDRQARWPVHTTIIDQRLVILAREGIAIPVPPDAAGLVAKLARQPGDSEAMNALSEGALKHLYPALAPPKACRSALAITAAGMNLSEALERHDAELLNSLDAFTDELNRSLARGLQVPLEDFAGTFWDDFVHPSLSEDDLAATRRLLSECADLSRGLEETIDILYDTSSVLGGQEQSGLVHSGIGNALIASTIQRVIAARYNLARNIVLVAFFHLSESSDPSAQDEKSEQLIEVLGRAIAIYHRYRILEWIRIRNGAGSSSISRTQTKSRQGKVDGGDDLLAEGFGGLKMREGDSVAGTDSDDFDTTYSLLHTLLASQNTQPVTIGSIRDTSAATLSFLSSVGPVVRDQVDVEPQAADVKLGFTILATGQSLGAANFTNLYPPSSGMAYIRGRSYLEHRRDDFGINGDVDIAVWSFEQAAVGCRDGALGDIMPFTNGPQGLMEYYRHVTQLFHNCGFYAPVAQFGRLAIQSTRPDDPALKDLWTKVFLAHISLGAYEDAYSVLTEMPHYDLKQDFLGQLISVMCENNEVGRLNSLGFIGFQSQVENLLQFKARNSDPLRFPNYYKVLYSWHISRGDYRSAGEIMFLQGRRFAESTKTTVSAFELATMQARSYLAAINTLALVDKRNAWVSVPAPTNGAAQRATKRRRVTKYIPEDEFTSAKRPVDIITLPDIQREYTQVLSRLQLSNHIRDLHEHGVSVSPEEIVGLFAQRGMFDQALSAASAMRVDMSDLFTRLAERCVELSRLTDIAGSDYSTAAFLQSSPLTARLRGPPPALALRYLELALTRYRYREVVSDTFFELNQDNKKGWQMPVWLVEGEMERDPEGWIARALRWGWVSEALEWSIDLLRRAPPPELLPFAKSDVADIPYNLFDRVMAAADELDEKDDPVVQRRRQESRSDIKRRLEGLRRIRGTA